MNILSPTSTKSPLAKDFGINESIEHGREKILAGHEKWKVTIINGSQYITQVHNIKDKARRSSDTLYPNELENYCKKLEIVRKVFEDVIQSVSTFKAQIKSSINILETMKEEPLKAHLKVIAQYLEKLLTAYEENFNKNLLRLTNFTQFLMAL